LLTDLQNSFTAGKTTKFAPTYLIFHTIAAQLWEVKKFAADMAKNATKMHQLLNASILLHIAYLLINYLHITSVAGCY